MRGRDRHRLCFDRDFAFHRARNVSGDNAAVSAGPDFFDLPERIFRDSGRDRSDHCENQEIGGDRFDAASACGFSANIYVALNNVQFGGWMNYAVYQWLRLPMQFVLIGWVWWCEREKG
jgi:hypothetical protein